MIRRSDNKGFTLIELIVFIIIGGIFVPVSLIAFTSVMNNYSRPDYYIKAKFLADKRMAEITNTPYDSITQASFCSTPTTEGGGYTTECSVVTINPGDLSTTSPDPYYKRITVTVKYSGLLNDHVISTIVTRRPKLP